MYVEKLTKDHGAPPESSLLVMNLAMKEKMRVIPLRNFLFT